MGPFVLFARRYVASIPLSVAAALLFLLSSIATGTAAEFAQLDPAEQQWGAGVSTASAGHWWVFVTALLIPSDPVQTVLSVLAAVVLLGVAERLLGPIKLLIAFFATGILGMIAGVLLQVIGSGWGEWWAVDTSKDLTLDPITGIIGALITASALMNALWQRRVRVVTFAVLLMFVLYDGDSANSYRLAAALAGLALGKLLSRDRTPISWHRSSHRETRVLVSTIIAVTAIGPVITLLNPDSFGAFSIVGEIFRSDPDGMATIESCAGVVSTQCDRQLALLSASGYGPVLLNFVPLALLLVAAWGLRLGRRFAYVLAITVNIALVVLAVFAFDVVLTLEADSPTPDASPLEIGEAILWAGAAVGVPLAMIIVLVMTRRYFALRTPREALIRWGLTSGLTFVAMSAAYFVVGALSIGTYIPDATLNELAQDVPRRFVPVSFFGTTGDVIVPFESITLIVFRWIGPLFWLIMIVGIVRLYRASDRSVRVGQPQQIRALLKRGGGGTLGWMATWPGNLYWFSDDGEAAVAYRVINGNAITMSDPICTPDRERQSVIDFAAFCDRNGWTPVFYSVHAQLLPVFDELGWNYMSVGEETLMHPIALEMVGKPWQKVRSALNRGAKGGLRIEWTRYDDLTRNQLNQINAISESWVAEKELPEMGFTLGALEEIKDPDVGIMLAVDADDKIHAVTSWLPMFRNNRPIGYTIDFMRRADDSMNGTMEYLIAQTALFMKDRGIEVLSLSGAPLATAPGTDDTARREASVMTTLLEFLAKTLEPAYGFATLFRFKAKFNPSYETIYMSYPDPLGLPAIGTAIGKAYLPTVSPKEAVALVHTLTSGAKPAK